MFLATRSGEVTSRNTPSTKSSFEFLSSNNKETFIEGSSNHLNRKRHSFGVQTKWNDDCWKTKVIENTSVVREGERKTELRSMVGCNGSPRRKDKDSIILEKINEFITKLVTFAFILKKKHELKEEIDKR